MTDDQLQRNVIQNISAFFKSRNAENICLFVVFIDCYRVDANRIV